MTEEARRSGVVLGQGVSGSQLLRELLARAMAAFPETFEGLAVPEPGGFRTRFAELLPRFELRRSTSPERTEIARAIYLDAASALTYADLDGERPLREELARDHAPLPLQHVALPGQRGFTPKVDFGGRMYVGDQLAALASELERLCFATHDAGLALTAIGEHAARGASLAGERFVLLGAGAELSPVYALLEAGAEVLWLDRRAPPVDHLLEPQLGGGLHYVEGGFDLLTQPGAVRATVLAFARGEPVRFGLYGFGTGAARAARLGLTMAELVRSLPSGLVRSLHWLLSPTAPTPVTLEDARCAGERQRRASGVQRALMRTGQLSPGHLAEGDTRISACVVSQQGASYQLFEYVGKRLAAEAVVAYGSTLEAGPDHGVDVSAHVLPVTATRALEGPVLAAAILGAPRYDMLVATPSTATAVGASLLVHDVLEPAGDSGLVARLSRLFARQFHGGAHAQPFALDGLLRMAALRALAQRPQLALELLR